MTPEEIEKNFEWYNINPRDQFFDQLEARFFHNATTRPLKIGFGHNTRRVEIIVISEGVAKDPELEALQGEKVVEE